MAYRSDAASDAFLGELSRQVFVKAAERLRVDPLALAKRLSDGRLADLVLELRLALYWAVPGDRDRIEALLETIDREPMAYRPRGRIEDSRRRPAEVAAGTQAP